MDQAAEAGSTVTLHRGWLDESSTHGVAIELIDVDEAAAFRAPQPAASPQPPPASRPTFEAVAIRVDELDAAHAFYVDTLGFAPHGQFREVDLLGVPVRVAEVRAQAGLALELFEYRGHRVVPASAVPPGISYVTFSVDDIEACRARLEAAEALMTDDTGASPGVWVHARSTDGLVVRLVCASDTASSKE